MLGFVKCLGKAGMSKILVTGADGFIGSHVVEDLLANGHDVIALAQYNSFGSRGWLEDIPNHRNLSCVVGDIRDSEFCNKITKNVDSVIHLAALIGIPYSYVSPRSYLETNISGTFNICQSSLENELSSVVILSTSEVYGSALSVPINEKHPLQPQSPYSASKIGADAIAQSFFNAFNLPITIARPFNTFGPRQSRRAFIPSVISQILNGADEIKVGDISTSRDFTFVKETAKFIRLMSERGPKDGTAVNIGTSNEFTMRQVIQIIQDVLGTTIKIVEDKARLRPSNSEVKRLVCDNMKLQSIFGETPQEWVVPGIEETVSWIRKNLNRPGYFSSDYAI